MDTHLAAETGLRSSRGAGERDLTLIWSQAIERGFSPYPLNWDGHPADQSGLNARTGNGAVPLGVFLEMV